MYFFFFFFNDTATTEIYTLSLHDALPIWSVVRHTRIVTLTCRKSVSLSQWCGESSIFSGRSVGGAKSDRKSTRLNSSHLVISYAVFCLKKKKKNNLYLRCSTNEYTHSDCS